MNMRVVASLLWSCCGVVLAAEVVEKSPAPDGTVTIESLMSPASQATTGINSLRAQMLDEGARTVGFRGGMISRARDVEMKLRERAPALDQMFQFSTLVGKDGALPPVIVEAADVASFSPDQIRTATHVYTIEKEERFVSVPPSWRDYLFAGLPVNGKVDLPAFQARPKDARESALWRQAVQAGWAEGERQVDAIIEANFKRLTRDFTGMLLYSALRQQGIISETLVAESNQSVTGDRKQITIGDKLRRITGKAGFVPDSTKWNANVRPGASEPNVGDRVVRTRR